MSHPSAPAHKVALLLRADQHHLHASYQICAEADFFKTEKVEPHSNDEKILFKVGFPAGGDCIII